MAIMPRTVDIVASDMARGSAFHRLLGLPMPEGQDDAPQVEVPTGAGHDTGFVTEAAFRHAQRSGVEPAGPHATLAFRRDSPAKLDANDAALAAVGHPGMRVPRDAFRGQRSAVLRDPCGNRLDCLAPLGAA